MKPDANGVVWVEAFTGFKLHDITTGALDTLDSVIEACLEIMQPQPSTQFVWATGGTPHRRYSAIGETLTIRLGPKVETTRFSG
ncbi:MAG: hypothetical protein R2748_26045 [Bryobacterales bacterium]